MLVGSLIPFFRIAPDARCRSVGGPARAGNEASVSGFLERVQDSFFSIVVLNDSHVRDGFALDAPETACSFSVLRNYGNMSSATLFFVLDQWRQTHQTNGFITAMGFGPGLVIEGGVLKVYE